LCPYQCDAAEHDGEPSYCILDAWHDIVDKSDPRGQHANHSIVHDHLFACKYFASKGLSHHIFVLDASGSMSGAPWNTLTDAVHGYLAEQLNQKGNACADIVSIVTFSSDGIIVVEAQNLASVISVKFRFKAQEQILIVVCVARLKFCREIVMILIRQYCCSFRMGTQTLRTVDCFWPIIL